jgi:hypothetical protein
MSKTLTLWKVEAEHPRRLTNAIEVIRAGSEDGAVSAFRRRQADLHVNFGPVTDEWPIVSVTPLAEDWREASQPPGSRPSR